MSGRSEDWNARTIEEFRKNHGNVGGYFQGRTLLLIHHKGARTGTVRVNPVAYLKDGDRYLIFASKGGAPTNPDWYHNLKAHPDIQIEVGDDKFEVHAEEIKGTERDKIYAEQAKSFASFGQYEQKTKRVIPVIALIPKTKHT